MDLIPCSVGSVEWLMKGNTEMRTVQLMCVCVHIHVHVQFCFNQETLLISTPYHICLLVLFLY